MPGPFSSTMTTRGGRDATRSARPATGEDMNLRRGGVSTGMDGMSEMKRRGPAGFNPLALV